jgi:hypothetical protein
MGWVRSKPVYAPLVPVAGAERHVLVSWGESGARAVGRALPLSGEWIFLHGGGETPLEAVAMADQAGLLLRLGEELRVSPASTVLAVAGPEQFVWECCRVGHGCGMSREQMQAELAGSAARSVYCVHCKAITPGVTTNPVRCASCGQALLVRDHFSRLMVAFAGVRIDAETPGDVPETEELFA